MLNNNTAIFSFQAPLFYLNNEAFSSGLQKVFLKLENWKYDNPNVQLHLESNLESNQNSNQTCIGIELVPTCNTETDLNTTNKAVSIY